VFFGKRPQRIRKEGTAGHLMLVKAIFSKGSLKLCALESIFSEWIH